MRQRRVMLKAIVGDIEGWRYGGQAAKIAVGVCAPGYARGGQKSVSRKPGVGVTCGSEGICCVRGGIGKFGQDGVFSC